MIDHETRPVVTDGVDGAKPKRVLVTGGAGFIGSHTCKRLAANGFLPVAYDNLSTGHREAVRWGPMIEADIADATALARACEAMLHFAAFAYVGKSVVEPEKYYRNNTSRE